MQSRSGRGGGSLFFSVFFSPSEKISQMADIIMNEFVTLLPSTVKDTTDFLQKCSLIKNIPEGAFVVTWDVIGLYPNIPIDEGIKASKWMLNKHRKGMVNPSNESVIKLLKLVLTCNNFEFNGEHYKQINGCNGYKSSTHLCKHFHGQVRT